MSFGLVGGKNLLEIKLILGIYTELAIEHSLHFFQHVGGKNKIKSWTVSYFFWQAVPQHHRTLSTKQYTELCLIDYEHKLFIRNRFLFWKGFKCHLFTHALFQLPTDIIHVQNSLSLEIVILRRVSGFSNQDWVLLAPIFNAIRNINVWRVHYFYFNIIVGLFKYLLHF